jgi:hypothetical protein
MLRLTLWISTTLLLFACTKSEQGSGTTVQPSPYSGIDSLVNPEKYVSVQLKTELDSLQSYEKAMLPHLIEAAQIMDELFWEQAFGQKDSLMDVLDERSAKYARINYGPWDRLEGDRPFISGFGAKSPGANMYPHDVTKMEIASSGIDSFDQYSMVRRDPSGKLYTIPYHEFFSDKLQVASAHLRKAAEMCEEPQLKAYLELRAQALLTDDFTDSDIAWLKMAENTLDIIIGPIENYEDKIYNARTAYEAYVLVKDKTWSQKLEKYAQYLPELQASLPVPDAYKKESPGTESQLNAYDVVYYAGDCNAGSKTIAVNLPNDEELQTTYGTRRSQLKNAMKAKFDYILVPIADVLIAEDQRQHITFDAFFSNTMFHEVAHGLGIKYTLDGRKVKQVLQEQHSPLEEGKADILGLYMVTYLREKGVITEGELMDNYVTFLASIFRSVRFGASSAHGRANMVRFNYFSQKGAFEQENGRYRVNQEKLQEAMNDLSSLIITLQGDGNKAGVEELMTEMGMVPENLASDLQRLSEAGIPVDVVFEQGADVLGLVD